ncbi:MAG: hypothetical protein AAGH64_10605, partial [Planctomycetota bacterium]
MHARTHPILRMMPAALVLLCVGGALWAVATLSQPEEPTRPEAEPMPVRVAPAEWSDAVVVTTRYTGEIQARQRVQLAFDLAGTIESIDADEGDAIDAGALVATLDTDRLQADLARLEASTSATRSDLQLARTTRARSRRSARA